MPPDMHFSVSQLDVFREWEEDEDAEMSDLLAGLFSGAQTEDMKRGSAFHAAMETAQEGDMETVSADGFTFVFENDFSASILGNREIRGSKNYGGLEVRGRVDVVAGTHIIDHKSVTWFDAERYFKKYQWRYYLDIFGADRFTWNIWEMKEIDEYQGIEPAHGKVFLVKDLHILEQFRYPDMERDCAELARRMKAFAEQHKLAKPAPAKTIEELLLGSVADAQTKKQAHPELVTEIVP